MKITLTLTNRAAQFELIPENNEERKMLWLLEGYSGEATIRGSHDFGYVTNDLPNRLSKLTITVMGKDGNE